MPEQFRITIGIQKSGRLSGSSLDLLKKCGIRIASSKNQLFCQSVNFPIDVLLLRDDDICELVQEGACDLGILGRNLFAERQIEVEASPQIAVAQVMELGFGHCRLALAGAKDGPIQSAADLAGKKIATAYPLLTRRFLEKRGIDCGIVTMSGALEIAPRLHIAQAICDLVATGETLAANGLREFETVLPCQAVLIRHDAKRHAAKEVWIERLINRIQGVMRADESKYIMLHSPISALEAVKRAIPGAESPTIVPLQGSEDRVAVHAVCNENVFWETMEQLKAAGASAILVLPIEKMLG